MSPAVSALVGERAPHARVIEMATDEGMRTIWADGLEKAAAGLTTIDELSRVVG
jgi:type II secretory ATPase GspE/PulE/Tfp pilus assembly ATPase PilB-like protein